jgi:N-acetylneuraminic acid mutarotase
MIHFCHTTSYLQDDIYVFGGLMIQNDIDTLSSTYPPTNTLLKYNKINSSWITVTPNSEELPLARNWHSAIVYNDELYIFGGKNNRYLNDMWKYDPSRNEWTEIQYVKNGIVLPSPRYGHKSVVIQNEMFVYGG